MAPHQVDAEVADLEGRALLAGLHVDEVIPSAGLICMQFPCLASMQMEQIDKGLYNTLMHLSGQIFNDELEPHLEPFYSDERREKGSGHDEGNDPEN